MLLVLLITTATVQWYCRSVDFPADNLVGLGQCQLWVLSTVISSRRRRRRRLPSRLPSHHTHTHTHTHTPTKVVPRDAAHLLGSL
jgi:hypothetical protein